MAKEFRLKPRLGELFTPFTSGLTDQFGARDGSSVGLSLQSRCWSRVPSVSRPGVRHPRPRSLFDSQRLRRSRSLSYRPLSAAGAPSFPDTLLSLRVCRLYGDPRFTRPRRLPSTNTHFLTEPFGPDKFRRVRFLSFTGNWSRSS